MNNHAISSRVVITWVEVPFSLIFSLNLANFELKLSPQYLTSNKNALLSDKAGLSGHILSIKSYWYSIFIPFLDNFSANVAPSLADITLPSNPKVPPSGIFLYKYSSVVGQPSCPILNNFIVLPSNWDSACIKYLPSVHNPASSLVTITVPAEPLNPDINSLDLK